MGVDSGDCLAVYGALALKLSQTISGLQACKPLGNNDTDADHRVDAISDCNKALGHLDAIIIRERIRRRMAVDIAKDLQV